MNDVFDAWIGKSLFEGTSNKVTGHVLFDPVEADFKGKSRKMLSFCLILRYYLKAESSNTDKSNLLNPWFFFLREVLWFCARHFTVS